MCALSLTQQYIFYVLLYVLDKIKLCVLSLTQQYIYYICVR